MTQRWLKGLEHFAYAMGRSVEMRAICVSALKNWYSNPLEPKVRAIKESSSVLRDVEAAKPPCLYGALVEMNGFEPMTPWLQTRCSARLSYIPERDQFTGAALRSGFDVSCIYDGLILRRGASFSLQ